MGAIKVDLGEVGGIRDVDALVDALRDRFYRVGTIYQSKDPTNPSEFIGGEWEQITGYFLRADNNTETGGNDSITLTVNNMPSHNHTFKDYWSCAAGVDNRVVAWQGTATSTSPYTTNNTGGGKAFDNRPKFQNVYTWVRVA